MSGYRIVLRPIEGPRAPIRWESAATETLWMPECDTDAALRFPMVWGEDSHVRLTIQDGVDGFPLTLEGLVSDGSLVFLDGGMAFDLAVAPAMLERMHNIHTRPEGVFVELSTASARLALLANLSVELPLEIGFSGDMRTMQNLKTSGEEVELGTSPTTVTLVILAPISAWTDYWMADLTDRTLQDMIYTEVG